MSEDITHIDHMRAWPRSKSCGAAATRRGVSRIAIKPAALCLALVQAGRVGRGQAVDSAPATMARASAQRLCGDSGEAR